MHKDVIFRMSEILDYSKDGRHRLCECECGEQYVETLLPLFGWSGSCESCDHRDEALRSLASQKGAILHVQ